MSDFATFDEFWAHYLREHSDPRTRALHIAGTTVAGLSLLAFLASGKKRFIALGLLGSYGPAWLSHFTIENNEPATFSYPLWSLRADLRMYEMWLAGTLNDELSQLRIERRSS